MFESAALPHVVERDAFKAEEKALRPALIRAQLRLAGEAGFGVVVVFAGMDGAGKGEALHTLTGWLDPRHVKSLAYGAPSDEERARPAMWRYWRDLPRAGQIAVVFGSWYAAPLADHVLGEAGGDGFERRLAEIERFETMLVEEGVLLLKFWFHLGRKEQKARLKAVDSSPYAARYAREEGAGVARYERMVAAGETTVRLTGTGRAPWVVVPSADRRYRDLMVGKALLAGLEGRFDGPAEPPAPAPAVATPSLDDRTILDGLDLTLRLNKSAYRERLEAGLDRLAKLTDAEAFRERGLVVVFEGNDAAGKGGSIRRTTAALDPRRYRVHSIAAPNDEEKARPYLWRFWRRLPALGQTAIFDRSWYGRVLVERVEGFAAEAEWLRAYNEINAFEAEVADAGFVVAKFWLAISPDEQLKRFRAREANPEKRYKITPDDWRNRDRLPDYARAVNDMVSRTSTAYAPWTLVEAEDKCFARVKVLETLCERVEAAL